VEAQDPISSGVSDPCLLLGGQPRSGTTLLSSILRATPGHFQAFELHIRKPSFVGGLGGRYTRNIFRDLGVSPEEYDRIVSGFDLGPMNLGSWVGPREEVSAEGLSGRETDRFTEELAARAALVGALMRRAAAANGKETWGFKILGDAVHAEQYRRAWPAMRLILMIRDPRDQAMSVMELDAQRQERGQQSFYADFASAARGWRATILDTRRNLAGRGIPCIETRYEDLILRTDRELARLSEFTGLDLAKGLRFHEQDFVEQHTRRFRHHDNLRNPINPGSLGKWRTALSAAEVEVFFEQAGPLMEELGYARDAAA
jgi:hypothetical protein